VIIHIGTFIAVNTPLVYAFLINKRRYRFFVICFSSCENFVKVTKGEARFYQSFILCRQSVRVWVHLSSIR